MRSLTTMCGAFALVACVAGGAHADEWNKRTYLTFSGPVQIPGATLPAGTYTFELANPDTTRHVIRVSEKESGKAIGLFMTIPQDRLEPPNDNLIMFAERPAGSAQAIRAWFYPGDRIGEEFVYPKSQATAIAKANRVGVLATEGGGVVDVSQSERMAALKNASVGRVDENGRMTSEESKPATTTADTSSTAPRATTAAPTTTARAQTAQPTTAESTTARATTAPRARTNTTVGTTGNQASNTAARRRELPRTGSNLVAFELLSGLAIAGAFGVRRYRLAHQVR